jgi:Ca2+-binding EF-hand superfamily protein
LEEFRAAIKSLRLGIKSEEDIKHLFQQFDTTNNGQIDLNEFLKQLSPPMSERRQKAVLNLFNSMDVNKDGKLTTSDLKVRLISFKQKLKIWECFFSDKIRCST